MSEAPQTYAHSGKVPPAGAVLAVGGTLVGASVLGWLYTEFVCSIPWIYVNAIAVVAFGYGVGAVASWLTRLGKARNPELSTFLGIGGGLVGLYVAWAHDVTVRGLYEGLSFSLSPGHVWDYVQAFNRDGGWTLNDSAPTGAALWAVWLVESCLFVGAAWSGSRDAIEGAVFCEPCERWTKLDRQAHRMSRDVYDTVLDQLMDGEFDVLSGRLGDVRPNNFVRVDLNTCPGCTESNYVTFVGVRISLTDDGQGGKTETEVETTLGPPLKIPADVAGALPGGTPAWAETGLRAPERRARSRSHSRPESEGDADDSRGQRRARSHGQGEARTRAQRVPARRRDAAESDEATRARRKRRRDEFESAEYPRVRRREKTKRRREKPEVVVLHCPHCDVQSRIPGEYAGKRGKCPRCRGAVTVPDR